jgi:translocation and assembly module TamB
MNRSRRIVLVLAAVGGALLLAATLALAWLNGDSGRTWLVARAGDALAPAGLSLTVEGLDGSLPQQLTAARITLADAGGTWLTIAGLELRWRPWSLLAGRIQVTALRSERVEWLRAPVTTATGSVPTEQPGWPRLLLRTRVAAIDIERVALGEDLLPGGPTAWRIQGELGAPAPAGLLHRLAIRRIDGRDDHLTARAVHDATGRSLTLRLELAEAPGGPLGVAAGGGPDTGLSLLLEGEGPLDDWRGQLAGEFGDARVDANLTVDGPAAGLEFDGRVVPGTLLSAVTGRADGLDAPFELATHLKHDTADERLSVTGLRLDHPVATMSGDMDLGLADGDIEARLTLAQRSPEAFARLLGLERAQQVHVAVEATGTLPRPEVTVVGEAGSVAVAGFAATGLRLRAAAVPAGAGWRFDARADSDRLVSEDPRTAPLLGGNAGLEIAGQSQREGGLTLDRIALALPTARLEGRARFDPATGAGSAPLALAVSDLRTLAGWTGLELAGGADLELDLARASGDDSLQMSFAGTTRELAVDVPVLRALVSPVSRLAGVLILDQDDGLTLRDLRLVGARATAAASLRIPAGFDRLLGDVAVEAPDASVLDGELGLSLTGPARAAGRLDGPLSDPGLTGTLTVAGLGAGPFAWRDPAVRYELARLASGITGPVELTLPDPAAETRVATVIALKDASFDLTGLKAATPGAELGGEISFPTGDGAISADLNLVATDVGPLLRQAGLGAAGSLDARLALFPAPGGQGGELSLDAESLRWLAGMARPVATRRLSATGRLVADERGPGLSLNARASGITGPSSDLDELRLDLAGPLSALSVGLAAEGRVLDAPAALSARLAVTQAEAGVEILLESLDGALADHPLVSRSPARLSFPDRGFVLDGLDLEAGGGALTGNARVGVPASRIELAARRLPLSLVSLVDPRVDLDGFLAGELELSGVGPDAQGRFELTLDPITIAGRRRTVPVTISAGGALRAGRLTFAGEGAGPKGQPVTLAGEAPLLLDLEALALTVPPGGPLSARIDWAGAVEDLLVMLPMNDHLLRGDLRVGLRLAGTVGDPRLEGGVTLGDAYYEHLLAGTVLSPLEVELVGEGDRLRVARFEAGAGKGSVTGEGGLELDPARGLPLSLAFEFEQARLIARDEMTARADGRLDIEGPLDDPSITGRIDVGRVNAQLRNNLPPDVVELDVVEVGADDPAAGAVEPVSESAADDATAGRLDIDVHAPERVFVRGLGLDSEWRGRLAIGGLTMQPTLTGQVESIRGVMIFLGRRFRIVDSEIRFPGGGEIEPEVDLRAVHEGSEYVVTLTITGPITRSEIELTSEPPLPESEILSQALFNKSSGELSALEAVQLAAAVGELSGRGGGPGEIVGRLRQAVGIDVLRVGSTETETGEQATSVEAGVYLIDGLYVGAETSTAEESGAVSIEYELTRRIRIKTDLEQTGGQNIGVEYKRDY